MAPNRPNDRLALADDDDDSGGNDVTVGDYEDPDTEPEVIRTADGKSLVVLDDEMEGNGAQREPDEFYENLAEVLPDTVMRTLAVELQKQIDEDKKAWDKRIKQYEEGIKRTGLGNDAPGGADFTGASKVVHPMITEACIDYESRIIKELWPIAGPVKEKILGKITKEKQERAQRKRDHMNWQLTKQIEEARPVMETTLTQVPLGGSQFIKLWWDHRLKRPRWEFVPVDNIYLPFSAPSFEGSWRKTHAFTLSETELRERMDSGWYRQVDLGKTSMRPESNKAEDASRKVEGKDSGGGMENIDQDRQFYEVAVLVEITPAMADILGEEEAGELYPYLITFDQQSHTVVGFYRNWEAEDTATIALQHLFEFSFIPWRGPLKIGFPQIIGGLSGAATGALRALLDSALVANSQGGVFLKGSGTSGQNLRPQPNEWAELEGSLEGADITKMVLPWSKQQPSPTLFSLLGFLVDAGKGTIRTSLDDIASDKDPNVPVGTTMARVEEGLVVFSAIHGRIHAEFNKLLEGLHRLNRMYLPERVSVDADGKEIFVKRSDYDGPMDIQPVSDPTIYSDQQRFAQLNYIQSRSTVLPTLYDLREVELAGLKLMKWPDPESLLKPAPTPHEINAVNENLAMSLGQPVKAFPEQDHLAHLQVLLDYMKIFGTNPLFMQQFLPLALAHAKEHIAWFYVRHVYDVAKEATQTAAGVDPEDLLGHDPETKRAFDKLLAQVSQKAMPDIQRALSGAVPLLDNILNQLKSMLPQPPMDPTHAALAETQRKTAKDQSDAQIGQGDLSLRAQGQQAESQDDQQKNALMAEKIATEQQEKAGELATREAIARQDNATALEIAEERISVGQQPGFSTGSSMDRGA